MRVTIVGAGAIGTWLGTRLALAGCEVGMLARGQTLAAILRYGVRVWADDQMLSARIAASDRAADLGIADLVIVSVKGSALLSVAPAVAELMGPHTSVLSAMNGIPWWFFHGLPRRNSGASIAAVDPRTQISSAIPVHTVLGCVIHAACGTSEPGCSAHKSGNSLIMGEPDGRYSKRLQTVENVFREAGFEVTVSARIQQDIWYKLWGNMTINPISALTGATGDRVLDDPLINDFVLRVMAEAAEIGARVGCLISESGIERNKLTRQLGAFKTSMLQDAEAGRALEIDALLAAPREIGAREGVATPNMNALHGLIRLFAAVKGLNPSGSAR